MHRTIIPGLVERRHPISDADRAAEIQVLAASRTLMAGFSGTMREAYDAMTAATPLAPDIVLTPADEPFGPGWWVRPHGAPADRALLFLHGGAFRLGSARAYCGLVSQLAARTGVAAFVLDYPLAPEHPFPAAYDAARAARRGLGASGATQVALVGDSAGAALALGALDAADDGSPVAAAVVLFSPWVDLALTGASLADPATRDPIFPSPQILVDAAAAYLAGADPEDGRASPLHGRPATLPPLAIQVGTDELLLDDARRYAERFAREGGAVRLDIFEGLHHVFQRSVAELQAARDALDAAADFIARQWRPAASGSE